MNFTRDPIIETVITPKEGFKLLLRASGVETGDEYQVDAIEVVSFGKSTFFRSLEKPKAFLLPVSDYEIIEIKETRVVLKKASIEKPIKIAGGKKPTPPAKEASSKEASKQADSEEKEEESKKGKKRKKSRSKKGSAEKKTEVAAPKEQAEKKDNEPPPPPRKMRALIPPPSALISDSISKYKEAYPSATHMMPEEGVSENPVSDEEHQPEPVPEDIPDHDDIPTPEEEILEEYHPHEDETIDQSLLPEQDIDEEDPVLKHHDEEE